MQEMDYNSLCSTRCCIPKINEAKDCKIRGVESKGMLCSESELNLSDESRDHRIKEINLKIGKSYFKNKSEKSIDISVTPNRPDCLGVRGIARDLASAGIGKLIQIKKKKLNKTINKK